jgi:hypothetical protein
VYRVLLVLAVACSSPPPGRAPVPLAVEVMPDVAFAELDANQRAHFMKEHVLPTMKPLFTGHDPKFAGFTCKTCHAETTWSMPNPELPHLDLGDLDGFEPADVEWMKTEIVPAMRKLLRDPELRCGRCHVLVESPNRS